MFTLETIEQKKLPKEHLHDQRFFEIEAIVLQLQFGISPEEDTSSEVELSIERFLEENSDFMRNRVCAHLDKDPNLTNDEIAQKISDEISDRQKEYPLAD